MPSLILLNHLINFTSVQKKLLIGWISQGCSKRNVVICRRFLKYLVRLLSKSSFLTPYMPIVFTVGRSRSLQYVDGARGDVGPMDIFVVLGPKLSSINLLQRKC